MAETDTPLENLKMAYKKIKSAQRNLFYAKDCDLLEDLIELKEKVIKVYEARGGTWERPERD